MRDIQNETSSTEVNIDKVGIRNLRYPITVLDKYDNEQHTVATISAYVNLPHKFRGTHMSRFIKVLNDYRGLICNQNIPEILERIKDDLESEDSHIEIRFPYFVEKVAPVSKTKSLMEYNCNFIASSGEQKDFVLTVEVPITTLCPCSKEIADRGAHNQRGLVTVKIRFSDFVWIEDIIQIVETCGSSEVYALLKREDEKMVTEKAYDNPVFVEDVVRKVAVILNNNKKITWYSVECENMESIHQHNAYAVVEKTKQVFRIQELPGVSHLDEEQDNAKT
jgi:GTP cyclohydrolase IB